MADRRSMRAAVLHAGRTDLSIEQVVLDPPRAGEVLVRIRATGVCSSDLSVIRGKVSVGLPLVPGHEAAGIIKETGPGVEGLRAGDRVVLSWAANCGLCYFCERLHPTLCDVYGRAAAHGALWDGTTRLSAGEQSLHHYSCTSSFAEYAIVPASACIPLPDTVPFAIGALIGCAVTTGFGAVINDAALQAGESVVVVGIGGVGVNALQAAVEQAAGTIIAIDADARKADTARAFGATHFIHPAEGVDVAAQVRALTNGRGPDHAIECTGNPQAMAMAYEVVRAAGTLVLVGIARQGDMLAIPATAFPGSKKRIVGSIYGGGVPAADMARTFDLYAAGRLKLDEQIGTRIPLDRINEALAWMEQGVAGRTIIEFDDL